MWRLAADVFNDAAMIIDLLSPAFPKSSRILVLAGSSMLRALCGVAAGSAKASLSAHFAKHGNLGEVNAKDSSQETVISLLGMLAGTLVVSTVTSKATTWVTLLVLLAIHLAMNTAAVRAVSMRSLNRQRANIVFSRLIAWDKVLTPRQVSAEEWIFERDGVLRWTDGTEIGYCKTGVSFAELMRSYRRGENVSEVATPSNTKTASNMLGMFAGEDYLLWHDWRSKTATIVLKRHCAPLTQAKAWCHALALAKDVNDLVTAPTQEEMFDRVARSLDRTSRGFPGYVKRLEVAGWQLDVAALETNSGKRVTVVDPQVIQLDG